MNNKKNKYCYYVTILQNEFLLFYEVANTKKEAFKVLKELKEELNQMIVNSKYQKVKDIEKGDYLEFYIDRTLSNDEDNIYQDVYYRDLTIKELKTIR